MKKFILFAFLLTASLTLLTGCDQSQKPASEGPVLAEVNKGVVTQGDFLKEIGRVPDWARDQFKDDEGKKKFLDELVKRELIYQHALDMKLDNDKEYITKVEDFKKMTLVSIVLKKEVEDMAIIDDTEAKAFFDSNADKFTVGTKIKASHILVETEKEANDIIEKLNTGSKFADLAKKLSKDTGSAAKGGDLGYFGRGQMVPEFERAAISLKPGEVSKPVKTRFGYHVIKLIDIKKGEPANFEQSKESIKRQLMGEKRKKIFETFVDKLKETYKVTTHDETLKDIVLPWESPKETEQTTEESKPETEQK